MESVNFRRVRLGLLFITFSIVLLVPHFLYPCGPVFFAPEFISSRQPEDVDAYVAGKLGVPLRTYKPLYAYIAYRYLSGQPLTVQERSLVTAPPAGYSVWRGADLDDAVKPWMEARAAVPGLPPSPKFEMWKEVGNYQTIVNCTPDAFKTAARTLLDRVAKHGGSSADVKEWVAGQDRVFLQCSGGNPGSFGTPPQPVSPLPTDVEASAPAWLKQDRAYQIAAANFYAGNFDVAHTRFLAVGGDASSPWQPWGKYLAGRSMIRQATLNPASADQPYDPKVLAKAEMELKQVLGDPKLQPVHEATKQILGFVDFRLHPEQREKQLGAQLAQAHGDLGFQQDLKDFILLVKNSDDPVSDLGRWMAAFRATAAVDPEEKEAPPQVKVSPIDEWKKRKTLPWLVLAISDAKWKDDAKDELIIEAKKVSPDSPAYATLVYQEARLSAAPEARKLLDDFLSKHGNGVSLSTRNLFLRKRLDVANDFDDFLAHAQRRPAATASDGYIDQFEDFCRVGDKNEACERAYFDAQAATVMDVMPLSNWLKAMDDKSFEKRLRQELAFTTWCRAVLAEEWPTAEQAAKALKQEMPETAEYLDPYLNAKDPGERRFAATFAILHWPGIKPSLVDQTLRDTPLNELNDFRMNWWCSLSRGESLTADEAKAARGEMPPEELASNILTPDDLKKGISDRRKIEEAENAPNYLEPTVLAWAKAHKDDPRVPEALHLAVTAGHLSCSTEATAEYSKQAFNLLHKNYPNSEWAKKTKYWYK